MLGSFMLDNFFMLIKSKFDETHRNSLFLPNVYIRDKSLSDNFTYVLVGYWLRNIV